MRTRTLLLAAGFALAGITAANAESGYEPRNDVPNGLTTKNSQRILQLNATPAGIDERKARPSQHRDTKTGNSGFRDGYTTFDVLDSIR